MAAPIVGAAARPAAAAAARGEGAARTATARSSGGAAAPAATGAQVGPRASVRRARGLLRRYGPGASIRRATGLRPRSRGDRGRRRESVGQSVAGVVVGLLVWGWVILPLVRGGPDEVRNTIRAKFVNKDSEGRWLP